MSAGVEERRLSDADRMLIGGRCAGAMHEVDTLTEMLTQRARSRPDTRLLIFLDRQTGSPTLAELDAAARLVASALRDRAPRGSRALLVYPTGPEFVAAFFGCLYAGVIPV